MLNLIRENVGWELQLVFNFEAIKFSDRNLCK